MAHYLAYTNRTGEEVYIGRFELLSDVYTNIYNFAAKIGYTIPYIRIFTMGEISTIDFGSHRQFYYFVVASSEEEAAEKFEQGFIRPKGLAQGVVAAYEPEVTYITEVAKYMDSPAIYTFKANGIAGMVRFNKDNTYTLDYNGETREDYFHGGVYDLEDFAMLLDDNFPHIKF